MAVQPLTSTFALVSNIPFLGVKAQSDTHYSSKKIIFLIGCSWRMSYGFHLLKPLISLEVEVIILFEQPSYLSLYEVRATKNPHMKIVSNFFLLFVMYIVM